MARLLNNCIFSFIIFTSFLLVQAGHAIDLKAGAEIYHMRRWRDGGTQQCGRMDGARFQIERVKGNGIYWGGDVFLASGTLRGKNASGRRLKSEINDHIYEGRFGYTLQNCRHPGLPFITLFGGYGYFHETNDFLPPSPIQFTFTDTFNYVVVGFLSGINFNPLLSMGINFRIRFMMNGRSEVTNDPIFETVDLVMNDETQYRLEAPITFHPQCACLTGSIIPFYEFRHFGGREGFPFDYIDTKFSLFGARLELAYRF